MVYLQYYVPSSEINISINIQEHFIYFVCLFCLCVPKSPGLIDLQSEANTISAKSQTLSIPDEALLPHQATFWQFDKERHRKDEGEKERNLLWIQAFFRSIEAESCEPRASFPQYRAGPWLLCSFHWNNLINGAEWVGGCGRSSDKSKTLMETEGKTQRGEELGSITLYRTVLEASNHQYAYVHGKIHYEFFIPFIMFYVHLHLIIKMYVMIFKTFFKIQATNMVLSSRRQNIEGS
jgi:hypothetical protein